MPSLIELAAVTLGCARSFTLESPTAAFSPARTLLLGAGGAGVVVVVVVVVVVIVSAAGAGGGGDFECDNPSSPACVPLTFAWAQVGTSTPVVLSDPTSPQVVLVAASVGQLFLQLTVSDGIATSPPVLVEIDVEADPTNQPPTCGASVDIAQVSTFASFLVDGSTSSDVEDHTTLAYAWSVASQPAGSHVNFFPPTADVVRPAVTVDARGVYVLQLVVTDTQGAACAQPATVTVTVTASNAPPTVQVDPLRATQNRTPIALVPSAVDVDPQAALQFHWRLLDFPDGGEVPVVVDADGTAHFTPSTKTAETNPATCAPGNHRCYVAEVTASDGVTSSPPVDVYVVSLNNQPIAVGNDGASQSVSLKLDASASHDDDDDALVATWTQTAGAALVGGTLVGGARTFVGTHVEVTPVDAAASGDFSFALHVDDGTATSTAVSVLIHFDGTGHRPVLTLARGVVRVLEGEPVFTSDLATATDADDGDVVTITWTRDDAVSNPLFPATLSGTRPDVLAPNFRALLASGTTTATYAITASDGRFTTSPQQLTIAVAPSAISQPGFWVSSGVDAADTLNPVSACGDSLHPCATLQFLLQNIVPRTPPSLLAGQTVFLTTGNFDVDGTGVQWPADLSLAGGFDPVTLVQTATSSIVTLASSPNATPAVLVGAPVTAPITFANVTFQSTPVIDDNHRGPEPVLDCNGCVLTLLHVGIVIDDTSLIPHHGVIVHGLGAQLQAGDENDDGLFVHFTGVSPGTNPDVFGAAEIADGAVANFVRCDLQVRGSNSQFMSVLDVENATAHVSRSRLELTGTPADDGSGAVVARASAVTLESSLVLVRTAGASSAGDQAAAVQVEARSNVAVRNCTLDGAGANFGVRVRGGRVDVMNTLLGPFALGVELEDTGPPASTSTISHCAFNVTPGNTLMRTQNNPGLFVDLHTASDITSTPYNQSGQPWDGNDVRQCARVDVDDFHLKTDTSNPCVDSGAAVTPGGSAPTLDFDGHARVRDPDIGAFEAP